MEERVIRYKTTLVSPQKGWLFLYLPNNLLGVKKRIWVRGTMNGKPFVATANPWKNDTHVITVNREMRKVHNVSAGDEVELEFTVSERPLLDLRVPDDFAAALKANPQAASEFDRLPPSHQKEFIFYVEEGKKPETREAHIRASIQMLLKTRHLYEDPAHKFPKD